MNLLRNREDLKKWLLATSDYRNEIQENLNTIGGYNEKFNNAIVRHSLDLKDQAIFHNPNAWNVTFYDMKKFDLVNPVIGKLATQVKASKLTDYHLTKKLLEQDEVGKFELRLDELKYGINEDDDKNKGSGSSGGGGGDDGTPGPGPPSPRTPQQEMKYIIRRLDIPRGIVQMFLQIILQLKILELLLDKIKKDFKIGKLEKEKENFQTYQKELLIRGNQA